MNPLGFINLNPNAYIPGGGGGRGSLQLPRQTCLVAHDTYSYSRIALIVLIV